MITVDLFFREYVFKFILRDIEREIILAREGRGGGNFLAALGLLCYTEVLGGFVSGSWERGTSKANFDVFFDRIGPEYVTFRQAILPDDPYSLYRCGMVHEYAVKLPCQIAMLKGNETCGVWKGASCGIYYFSVEKYLEDFMKAARRLYEELMTEPNPSLPRVST